MGETQRSQNYPVVMIWMQVLQELLLQLDKDDISKELAKGLRSGDSLFSDIFNSEARHLESKMRSESTKIILYSQIRENIAEVLSKEIALEIMWRVLVQISSNRSWLDDKSWEVLLTKSIPIENLAFEMNRDLRIELSSSKKSKFVKYGKYFVIAKGQINIPQLEAQISHLDIINLRFKTFGVSIDLEIEGMYIEPLQIELLFPSWIDFKSVQDLSQITNTDYNTNGSKLSIKSEIEKLHYMQERYQCNLSIQAPEAILNKIKEVDYLLHPTFQQPLQKVSDRSKMFSIALTLWGGFEVKARIIYNDATSEILSHWIKI